MKKIWLVLCYSFLFAETTEFPDVIDFRKVMLFQDALLYHPPGSWTAKVAEAAYEMGYIGFNDSPEIGIFIELLKEKYGLEAAVETGTFFGATSLYFSLHFRDVFTIEASEKFYQDALERFRRHPNIHCCFGSSDKVLPALLPSLKDKRLLFYLDAHAWYEEADKAGFHYWPILEELEEISKTHKDNCVVVIDDFYVPNTNIRGCIDRTGKVEMSHDLVKEKLGKIFTGYTFHYLIPKNVQRAAKFVAIPKKWQRSEYKGRIDVFPGQDFWDAIRTDLSSLFKAGFDIAVSHRFFNGHEKGDYSKEIQNDQELKKIIVFNNTVDPSYLYKMPKDKLVLFVFEPMEISDSYFEPCGKVYTWNDDLVDNVKFFKLYYPHLLPMEQDILPFEKKKLAVMISGSDNAYPERRNELYSERVKMVDFFETKPEGEFDLYGRFWAKRRYRDYRGAIPGHYSGQEKVDVLKKYRFCICFENTKDLRGYISEKIFDCFAAGCVPIYWGASNIAAYIPRGCFIDYRDFKDREEMYQFIKAMPSHIYEEYLDNIRAFLGSKEAQVFSPAYLENSFYEAVAQ